MTHRAPKRTDPPREPPREFLDMRERDNEEPEAQQSSGSNDPDADDAAAGSLGGGSRPVAWWLPFLSPLVGAVPLAKLVRRRRRASAGPASARIVGGWREVLDLARDLGKSVPTGLTRAEQAARLGLGPGLADAAQTALFARDRPADDQAAAFWAAVAEQRRELRRRAGPVRRAWALWNPASLRPRRYRTRRTVGTLG